MLRIKTELFIYEVGITPLLLFKIFPLSFLDPKWWILQMQAPELSLKGFNVLHSQKASVIKLYHVSSFMQTLITHATEPKLLFGEEKKKKQKKTH